MKWLPTISEHGSTCLTTFFYYFFHIQAHVQFWNIVDSKETQCAVSDSSALTHAAIRTLFAFFTQSLSTIAGILAKSPHQLLGDSLATSSRKQSQNLSVKAQFKSVRPEHACNVYFLWVFLFF